MKTRFSGFTLFEMLIAVALMALLLTATLGSGVSLLKGDKQAREQKYATQDIYASLHKMEQDISRYLSDFKADSAGGLSFRILETDDLADVLRSGQKQVSYRIDRVDGLVKIYRLERDAFMNVEPVESELLVAKNVLISYMNDNRKSSFAWSGTKTPALVVIRITDKNGRLWERSIPVMVRTG